MWSFLFRVEFSASCGVAMAIQRLKLNKANGYDGHPAELFKATFLQHMVIGKHASNWNHRILCSVLKEGDATIFSNYRGISSSMLRIAYRILSSVLCERLKPFVNKLIGSYRCGVRPDKSTTDQIFTLRQIL